MLGLKLHHVSKRGPRCPSIHGNSNSNDTSYFFTHIKQASVRSASYLHDWCEIMTMPSDNTDGKKSKISKMDKISAMHSWLGNPTGALSTWREVASPVDCLHKGIEGIVGIHIFCMFLLAWMISWQDGRLANEGQMLICHTALTHWPLGDVAVSLNAEFSTSLYKIIVWGLLKLVSYEFPRTSLMKCQHWFRQWLDAVRQ